MNKQGRALALIRAARTAAEEELIRHREGKGTVGSLRQLEAVCEKLITMEQLVNEKAFPPIAERDQGMGRMVVDSWPMESSLGELVLKAEQECLKL